MTQTPEELFADRLRELRQAAGMSQAAFADRLSEVLGRAIYPSAITRIEKGDRSVRLDEAVAAARALDVPLGSLVSDKDPVDVELDQLRGRLREQEARAHEAEEEFRQSQLAMAYIERQIEALEASRNGRSAPAG